MFSSGYDCGTSLVPGIVALFFSSYITIVPTPDFRGHLSYRSYPKEVFCLINRLEIGGPCRLASKLLL